MWWVGSGGRYLGDMCVERVRFIVQLTHIGWNVVQGREGPLFCGIQLSPLSTPPSAPP